MIYLEPMCDARLTAAFTAFTENNGYTNAFNPSIAQVHDVLHITFRAESFPGEKPFRSFYTVATPIDGDWEFSSAIDLSSLLSHLELPRVADPKLVQLGKEVHATFNTGYTPGTENDIYLMRLWPTQGPAQRCTLSKRQLVEKNWAFYLDSQQNLSAIYSLSPLTLLRLTEGKLGESDCLQFSPSPSHQAISAKGLSIGTQLSFSDKHTAFLIAHEKLTLLKWRGYFGRVVRFNFRDDLVSMQVAPEKVIHSLRKMAFIKKRHNPNLLWATYFSGIVAKDDKLLLSYGINDVELSFANAALEAIWP